MRQREFAKDACHKRAAHRVPRPGTVSPFGQQAMHALPDPQPVPIAAGLTPAAFT